MTKAKAHSLAIDARHKLGLQSTEFVDVYRAITILNIACVKRPLKSNISGATFMVSEKAKIMLINSCNTLGHQNFTIAHEIYHCLYDESIINRTCKAEVFNRPRSSEDIADLFAVYLLMPEDGIYRQLSLRQKLDKRPNLVDIVCLEQYFGVSRRAMCWRLEELKLISRSQSEGYAQDVKQSARVLGKDIKLYESTEERVLLSDYAEKAKEALDKELITESRYHEILTDAGILDEILAEESHSFAD